MVGLGGGRGCVVGVYIVMTCEAPASNQRMPDESETCREDIGKYIAGYVCDPCWCVCSDLVLVLGYARRQGLSSWLAGWLLGWSVS